MFMAVEGRTSKFEASKGDAFQVAEPMLGKLGN
jgi:hypothetical protein